MTFARVAEFIPNLRLSQRVKAEEPEVSPRLVRNHQRPHNRYHQQQQQFRFQLHTPEGSASPSDSSSLPSASSSAAGFPFRFGATPHSSLGASPRTSANVGMSWPANTPAYTLPFGEYDDDDDEPDTPGGAAAAGGKGNSKAVRRRSSKACDQCRKSKCKCERPAPGEPCRSCVVLGTECTSLGPSRKRGPPKGYIDAIEARLHQTEALVGILLAAAGASYSSSSSSHQHPFRIDEEEDGTEVETKQDIGGVVEDNKMREERRGARREKDTDPRAHALLADLAEDPLARAILARIDQSAYGPAGRAQTGSSAAHLAQPSTSKLRESEGRGSEGSGSASPVGVGGGGVGGIGKLKGGGEQREVVHGGHPSHEWMDRVTAHVLRRARERRSQSQGQNLNRSISVADNPSFHSPVQPSHPHAHVHTHNAPNAHPLSHSQSHPHLRSSYEQHSALAHSPVARPRSGASTPNGMYAQAHGQYGQLHPQAQATSHGQQQLRTHQSAGQLRAPGQQQLNSPHVAHPPQRPAIITALGDEYRPHQQQGHGGFHPLSAGGYANPPSAISVGGRGSVDAGSEGRRLRRRVDGGPDYSQRDPSAHAYHAGNGTYRDSSAYRDASGRAFYSGDGSFRSPDGGRGRGRSYSPSGSGSEAELDVDVPHSPSPPPHRTPSYLSSNMREQRGGGHGHGHGHVHAGHAHGGAEGLAGAVGQLSLNEDEQVRYHGKVTSPRGSGGGGRRRGGGASVARAKTGTGANGEAMAEGEDDDGEVGRNVGGIWRFPKARVWPVAPAAAADDDYDGVGEVDADGLPPRAAQEALLTRYFTHVHPSFPVVHKRAVQKAWDRGEGPPPLLLLAMFALAARHAPQPPSSSVSSPSASPAPSHYMWPAGDAFLFRAKALLDSSYASSRASTCQALLLMGFREIGIGAMAQAWIYIGMAVRMAQDLGMQRDADGWVRAGVRVGGKFTNGKEDQGGRKGNSRDQDMERAADAEGQMVEDGPEGNRGEGEPEEAARREDGKLFGGWEIAERRRIWYACVIMDKYVSTYIGRPLAIFERDFDTSLPSESDAEELEEWAPPSDAPVSAAARPGRVISCFNASARLSGILSQIVQSIYALRPAASRHAELVVLDGLLEKWRLALPAHLEHDPARSSRSGVEVPLPQVLTLHMQYWCAVLLLHRPFIRQNAIRNKHSPAPEEGDVRGNAEKSYELCAGAANHITSIGALYSETYTLKHCAVFLCYYTFTASIMHVTSLSAYPTDPQARIGLIKCMELLKEIEIIWPAAGRQLALLTGTQAALADAEDLNSTNSNSGGAPKNLLTLRQYPPVYHPNGQYVLEARNTPASYYPPAPSTFERWPTEDGGALAFQGALSTAVMGPAYSTGLVDEPHRAPAHEGESRFGQQPMPQQQQYWNEYAAFTPLGPGYGELHDPSIAVHGGEPQLYPLHDFALYPPNHHRP
ncbi:Zn(2)-C6 fungal-type domain-containing protein [Mycena venus]|uniref:Zn(2)-C6 fungal-type domain-containing protein n=1 Tax=Mycena venus TaxID=2733690 RepID=A0A8H6XK43_9AGAR|nr:Zn(2)-C6 fungal-type domain-containing protein [Mycena venus]